jgi:hypothetical protein
LSHAVRFYPWTNGKPPHSCTLTRHILKGTRLKDGTVLKLRAKRTPGGWVVSREDIDEFIDRLTRDRCGDRVASETPLAHAREKVRNRADDKLDAIFGTESR